MPDCMQSPFLLALTAYVLPPAGAVLSAIALWVAAKARTTSADAHSTSQAAVALSLLDAEPPRPSGSRTRAQDRKK
jgi:hypothetical protein